MEVGLRVVRGKDWKWGDQDGGEGGVGTVVEVGGKGGKIPRNAVVVTWDTGTRANYRAGRQGANDLRVLDNASAGVKHRHINCDICKESGLIGTRWKCTECIDFDLCHACYMGAKHDLNHAFTRWDTPLSYGVKVPSRASSRRVSAKGIYPGSRVIRGIDWSYSNQDGGDEKQGTVQSIGGANDSSSWRSWAKVNWDVALANDYRRGDSGKMEVKCVKEAKGELFYVDHLSSLGDYASTAICNGERVKLDESVLTAEMKSHYRTLLGKVGKAIVNNDTQEVLINFPGIDGAIPFSTSSLCKATIFRKGDVVMIEKDPQKVIRLQRSHGGWNEQMKSCLGQKAEVIGLDSDGDVKVSTDGRKWIFNPECCTLLTRGEGNDDDEDDDDDDKNDNDNDDDDDDDETTNQGVDFLAHFFKTLLEEAAGQALRPESLVKMAAEGQLGAVKAIISKHPKQLDIKVSDMTALQVAAHQGHLEIVVALVNAGARPDMVDSNGDNVLHFATIGNQPMVLDVLLKHRPQFSSAQNGDKRTCLHLAVMKQHTKCVEILLKYDVGINVQDKDGDTALHLAIERPDIGIQNQLIGHSKIDFKLKNDKGFNVIHQAALKNNQSALGRLIQKAPALLNVAKSDGYTALHICAVNGYKRLAEILINTGKANMNMKNNEGFTPLLLAVHEARCSMIELLVDKGADMNAQDKDGDTALHLAIQRVRVTSPQVGFLAIFNIALADKRLKDLDQAPAIAKIMSNLPPLIQQKRDWIAICCYLLQKGADLDQPNNIGKAVGDLIGDNLKQLFKGYTSKPKGLSEAKNQSQSQQSVRPPSSPTNKSCLKCRTVEANMTFYPCGHKVVCSDCSAKMKECFSCQKRIQEKVKSSDPSASSTAEVKSSSNNAPSTEKQRRSKMVGDTVKCPLCEKNDRNVVFLCGHSCCKDCSDPLVDCHVCSQPIVKKLTLM